MSHCRSIRGPRCGSRWEVAPVAWDNVRVFKLQQLLRRHTCNAGIDVRMLQSQQYNSAAMSKPSVPLTVSWVLYNGLQLDTNQRYVCVLLGQPPAAPLAVVP